MTVLTARRAQDQDSGSPFAAVAVVRLADGPDTRARLGLWATMVLASFVLLIGCANLANLQFARTAHRTRELTIRAALGATRGRLLRQLLTESLLLVLVGGGLGLVLAQGGIALLARHINESGELVLGINWRVLGFALGASAFSGIAFGLVPAWLASRANAHEALKQGGRGIAGNRARERLQHTLIVAEVALALALLAGAGQMMSGLRRFTFQNPGWQVEGLTVANLSLPEAKYSTTAKQRAFATRLKEELTALPGVAQAAVCWSTPIRPFDTKGAFGASGHPEPQPGREPIRHMNAVTPGYFEALGMRLVAGRLFTAGDREAQTPVVIVNETLARTFWPGGSAIGQRIGKEEIVGVVGDVRFPTDASEPVTRFQTYRPFAQAPRGFHLWIVVRGPARVEALRQVVASIDPDLPLAEAGLAQSLVDRSVGRMRALGWLLTAFGGLGLLLATLGIYGVIAGFAAQRTSEIGVRLALGAQLRDVLWLVLGKGLRLTLLGVAIGLIGAFAQARLIGSVAPGLSATAPTAIAGVVALLVGVATLACWLPARSVTRVDPMIALRCE